MGWQADMVTQKTTTSETVALLGDLPERLAAAPFRKTKRYDPPHEYVMTFDDPERIALWHDLRSALVLYGIPRPFYKSRQTWKYLDLPDGYTYWVVAQWLRADWRERFDPSANYAINRQQTDIAIRGDWLG